MWPAKLKLHKIQTNIFQDTQNLFVPLFTIDDTMNIIRRLYNHAEGLIFSLFWFKANHPKIHPLTPPSTLYMMTSIYPVCVFVSERYTITFQYFIWQLSALTSCRLIHPINIANSADSPHAWVISYGM